MLSTSTVLRTCGLTLYLIFQVHATVNNTSQLFIKSLEVGSVSCDESQCKYLLNVSGGEFLGHHAWRLTAVEAARGAGCGAIYPDYELRELETARWSSRVEVRVPRRGGRLYFCLRERAAAARWLHQGADHFLEPKNDVVSQNIREYSRASAGEQQLAQETSDHWADLSHDTDVNYLPSVARPTRAHKHDPPNGYDAEFVTLEEMEDRFNDDNSINDYKGIQESSINDTGIDDPSDSKQSYEHVNYEFNSNVIDSDMESVAEYTYSESLHVPNDADSTAAVHEADDITENYNNINVYNLNIDNVESNYNDNENNNAVSEEGRVRKRRQVVPMGEEDFDSVRAAGPRPPPVFIEGLRVEEASKEPKLTEEGIPSVLADSAVTLRLYGEGLTPGTVVAFTHDAQPYGQPCKFLLKGEYVVREGSLQHKTALVDVVAPGTARLHLCAKNLPRGREPSADDGKYVHQGAEPWKVLEAHAALLPLWAALALVLACLTFSALFSGLNLGLMSLDRTELKIIANTGTERERAHARAIMPVRDHGNYLLCSILLGNVAVNSTFTILLDELTSGLFAVIFSTLAIVLLGEITPQAICSRHGLMVGARSIVVTKAVMAVTAPLSFPVSKLLDYFLGEEIGNVYNRERLKELVKIMGRHHTNVTTDVNDLDKDEVNIISGALELRKKTVADVMTKLEDVFMLPISSILDFETMSEIVKSGFSRIPVYEGARGDIVTVLFIKDLAFVDPDDNTPLRTLCQYYQNTCNFVFEDVTLDVMFKQFKDGHKGHMAFVHRINSEGEGDPFYETVGLVTLEDVIEEMIQAEIVDETDVFTDNRSKRRRNRPQNKLQDFAAFAERHENQRIHISPQLTLATFQFLSTSVDAFRPDTVSETVLRRLLRQDVIHHIKVKEKSKKDASTYVFQQGKPVDYFVLVLEGRVEVTVGRENLVFEAGPFTYFGVQALAQTVGVAESPTPSAMGSLQNINMDAMLRHTFVPDYSVRAITSLHYLTVKRSLYLAAKRATLMEKGNICKGGTNEQFDTEVDKHLCNTSSANIPISMISKKLLGKSTSTASTKEDVLSSTSGFNKLLQSVDEDLSITGEHRTPSRQVSPHLPVSPSPRGSGAAPAPAGGTLEPRNGHAYAPADEQERLLK